MLSYRHAYHAGNFADVMKHVVLTAILRYLAKKDAALCYVDTHAGAGMYKLDSTYARKNAEHNEGIARLWQATDAPAPVADYLGLVRRLNIGSELKLYPGSPWFAAQILRPADRMMLCELHGSDISLLETQFATDRRAHCYQENGYQFAQSLLPPRERRGLIFMDPSYELRGEYETAVSSIAAMHRRFATGVYALWYPVLNEHQPGTIEKLFAETGVRKVLHLALRVAARSPQSGMYGCGVIVINPPWTLREEMSLALPWLAEALALDASASFLVEQWADE
ncbi:MAG TPA: 23S rRNA (adenine(2030)-N(6))-methyltransferase RlmJ [Woeseiaceae bacterium]|nr:23S rRNA (adenine(2030)-N(6))-methyltransferase RlmJ [Woeseiaceae bacterium]